MRVIVDAFGGYNAPLEIIKGAALAVAALFPARGLCNVSWGFYEGKKTLAVSAMLRQRDTKLPAKLQTVLKSIKLGN